MSGVVKTAEVTSEVVKTAEVMSEVVKTHTENQVKKGTKISCSDMLSLAGPGAEHPGGLHSSMSML